MSLSRGHGIEIGQRTVVGFEAHLAFDHCMSSFRFPRSATSPGSPAIINTADRAMAERTMAERTTMGGIRNCEESVSIDSGSEEIMARRSGANGAHLAN